VHGEESIEVTGTPISPLKKENDEITTTRRSFITTSAGALVGVIFDVGNTVGTLDDPTEATDVLGPYTVATHYKDFAIEEEVDELSHEEHLKLEQDRMTHCIAYLKKILTDVRP